MTLDRALDDALARSMIGRESPNDLIVDDQNITRIGESYHLSSSLSYTHTLIHSLCYRSIGNLCDVGTNIRKFSVSFNTIACGSLDGIDQLPQLRHLSAYSCGLKSLGRLVKNWYLSLSILPPIHSSTYP